MTSENLFFPFVKLVTGCFLVACLPLIVEGLVVLGVNERYLIMIHEYAPGAICHFCPGLKAIIWDQ